MYRGNRKLVAHIGTESRRCFLLLASNTMHDVYAPLKIDVDLYTRNVEP